MITAGFAEQAAAYEAALAKAQAALPALIAEREAAEAAWAERGGAVRMWCAREAVTSHEKLLARLRREVETHRLLADIVGGRRL